MALTERQQTVKKLEAEGKTPDEIAKAMGITPNAVYQHLRRIRGGNKTKSRRARPRASDSAVPARKLVGPARVAATHTPPMTPLAAIRARRQEIDRELREATNAHTQAVAAAEKAKAAAAALVEKHKDELKGLVRAEEALTGRPVIKAAPKRAAAKASSNGVAPKGVVPATATA